MIQKSLFRPAAIGTLLSLSTLAACAAPPSPVDSVNPFVGTAEHGHTYPGAQVPFGMVQLSPDTPLQGWDGSSGYHYSDNRIRGFSHSHLMGTGVGGLGDILLMPTVGEIAPGNDGYSSKFSHAQESASPGYYRVFLQDPKVTAELTATARSGFHKYTFPASDNAYIVLDLEHGIGNSVAESSMTVENSTTISGTRISNGWGGRRAAYFVMQFSKPFDAFGIRQDGTILNADQKSAQGKALQALVHYKTAQDEVIYVKVGISGTGVEGARKNLASEIPAWDFQGVHNAARAQWSTLLNKVQIETTDPKIRRTFYTNFYQSCLAPVLFNDVDGTYRGGDRQNHSNPGFQNYTTFSLWDTFRAQHPLLTLVQPERVPDMVNSMLALERQRGRQEMPVWPLWGNETGTMIGYHSAPVIADAYFKGFKGFDAEAAYQALRATALNERNGQDEFARLGYVVSEGGSKQSVSRSLEFAYDDWCIAKLAEALGHKDDAQMFFKRATNYRNLFDRNVGFMRGRKADGSWRRNFSPKMLMWDDYTEANAWQYTWTAMQDSPGLVDIMGGDAAFIQKMEAMFNEKDDVVSNIPDITGLIGQYAHGNEPVHHVAYLYNYAGAPYKTQERVRQIVNLFYNDTPIGAPGNNDCGQMSAWYVFSALGFYPVNPAEGLYVIGSPVVDKAMLNFGKRPFTVVAENNSPQNIYIQSATLNGRVLENSYISHAQLLAGGELRFKMGSKPNKKWGNASANRPPSGLPAVYTQTPLPTPSSTRRVVLSLPIRVAAGSNDPVAGFISDPNMEEGQINSAGAQIDVSAPNAAPAQVYQSERYGSDFTFSYQVPTGKYSVRLHFAEIFNDSAGRRIENVDINGQRVLTNFDTFVAAGGMNKAVVKEFRDIAPNAQRNITIRISAAPGSPDQNAKISAIEILAQ
jgi:predicted alpha-1,2-mannosidase